MKIIDAAHEQAIKVIESCAKKTGFYASGLKGGYEATWARDSMITSLGAGLMGDKFKIPFRKSLELLSNNQSELGQIPNAVGTYNTDRRSDVTFNTVDSSLWYIIGHFAYAKCYQDKSLLKRHKKNINKAYVWLKYQDPNEVKLIAQQPTMDWEDAFPHKYGHTISTQALYYGAMKMLGDHKRAEHVKKIVNGETEKYLSLYDKRLGFYLPWNWKNHAGDREEERWFDTFGNVMAIITGLATPKIAESIIRHIEKTGINKPYPCKAIFPPIKPRDKEWHSYFSTSDARTPYEYLNGGIWPFIGGFYVVALVKTGNFKKAEKELERLAGGLRQIGGKAARDQGLKPNGKWGFHEWLHGRTGKPIGNSNPYQAWSAGAYLFAYECVKQRKTLLF